MLRSAIKSPGYLYPRSEIQRITRIDESKKRARRIGGYVGVNIFILSLILILLGCASAQQPHEAAIIRGHFSEGNGTWRAEDFGWFYYDLDKGVGGEQLSVEVEGRLSEKGHIIYSSHDWFSDFEYKPWGRYKTVAFLGKRYLAGYPDSSFTDTVSSLGKGELRAVLIDNKDVHTLTYNRSLSLLNGYTLTLDKISQNNEDVASFVLFKDKKPVHLAVVSTGGTYVFKIGNIPIILVHISKAMRGEGSGDVEVDGVFQVSDAPDIRLFEGGKLGNMEVTALSEDLIECKNSKALSLMRNSNVLLLDGLELIVPDESRLVYYPQGGIFSYGVHEIRGPVYMQNTTLPLRNPLTRTGPFKAWWSFDNFQGFYFDPTENLGSENLFIDKLSGRSIPSVERVANSGTVKEAPPGLWYITRVQPTRFKFGPWGYYNVTELFGQLWFAGYGPKTSNEIGSVNAIKQYRIIQLIHDSNNVLPLNAGKALTLGEGYKLALISVNEDKAAVTLSKDGMMIEKAILKANSTYRYKKDLADVKDLPIIVLHVQNVFTDGKNESMMIDGLFQISDKGYLPVDPGRKFDKLVIIRANSEFIAMANLEDSINLSRDKSVSVWPGMNIRSADNDSLRYYLYTMQYVVPVPKMAKDVAVIPANVPSSDQANFSMIVRAGDMVKVTSEILDPSARRIYFKDLTHLGRGSEDLWGYFWTWNATVLKMSDDNSSVMDSEGGPVLGLLYLNQSSAPLQVGITFDNSGRIARIGDNRTIYYLSPGKYKLTNSTLSYQELLVNSTVRKEFIKIESGVSRVRIFDVVNRTVHLSTNHTLTGPIESLEPHAVRIEAPPGRYELRARIQNAIGTLQVSGVYFNVTAEGLKTEKAINGSITVISNERKKSDAPAFIASLAAILTVAFARRRC